MDIGRKQQRASEYKDGVGGLIGNEGIRPRVNVSGSSTLFRGLSKYAEGPHPHRFGLSSTMNFAQFGGGLIKGLGGSPPAAENSGTLS